MWRGVSVEKGGKCILLRTIVSAERGGGGEYLVGLMLFKRVWNGSI